MSVVALKYSYCLHLVLGALGQSNWLRHPIAFRLLASQVGTGWSDPMHVAENEDKKRRYCTCAANVGLEYAPIQKCVWKREKQENRDRETAGKRK
jgi:hypothetical protein